MKTYYLWIVVEEHDTEAKGRRFRDLDDGPQVSVGIGFSTFEAAQEAALAIQRMELYRKTTG
jgi:hypothetical protein